MVPVPQKTTGYTEMKFPPGQKIGANSRRWSPAVLATWEAANDIDLPAPSGMLSVRQVAERYSVSVATIWRWCRGHPGRPPAPESRRAAG